MSHDHPHKHNHEHENCSPCAIESIDIPLMSDDGSERWSVFHIEAMDCPTEETLLRDALSRQPAIKALDFNLMQRRLRVRHTLSDDTALIQAISALGMEAIPVGGESNASSTKTKSWWPLLLAGIAALAAEFWHLFYNSNPLPGFMLALFAILLAGIPTYIKGWISIKNRSLNINALMSIAVTGALLIGDWPEAAMVMVLFAAAEHIEALSLDRARHAIRDLLNLAPRQATILQEDSWQLVNAADVPVGAIVRTRPGEHIALDGEVIQGQSSVNQAPITGESLPVEKQPGDALFAGTINGEGELEFRVTRPANDSTLARIIHAVEEAQGSRAPTQRFVDKFSAIYTPTVIVLATLVAIAPSILLGADWLEWIYRALVLLVIACPCALVISTPVTVVSGLSTAARLGILIKGGAFLEQGRLLSWVALDKTGTITEGKPKQTDFVLLGSLNNATQIAASLAARSDHPVSKAIAQAAQENGQTLLAVDHFAALTGRGTTGTIEGRTWQLGNHRLVEEMGICSPTLEEKIEALEKQGKTVVVLMDSEQPHALFAVADTVKPHSRTAIQQLHGMGIKTIMLTGDNPHTAAVIAQQVGIDEVRGNQLPADKLQAVKTLQEKGATLGMVGDGINDAPALARADIGFAMGAAGSDTAIETASVALMDDDLRKLPQFIRLSQKTHHILWQNIGLALGIKTVFFVLTLMGIATLWMAVFADMGASLLVIANGLRLLRAKPWLRMS